MKLIGITGPTGAGKTTALHALASLGAAVIDADAMYHDLLSSDQGLKEALAGTSWTGRGRSPASVWGRSSLQTIRPWRT